MKNDKAHDELIQTYPGLAKPGYWVDAYGNVHAIRNMEASHIRNVIRELNNQFRAYCARNEDGAFVGKSAESIQQKLEELQAALPGGLSQ